MLRDINDVILNFDEPFADSSALPSYLLAKNTSKYFKVALTGDGGDEIFGGYNKYLTTKIVSNYVKIIPEIFHNLIKNNHNRFFPVKSDERGFNFKIKKFLDAVSYNEETFFNLISLGYSKDLMLEIFNDRFVDNSGWDYFLKIMPKNPKLLNDFKKIDSILSLDGDLLTKVDRTSMLSSIECRSPFLNKELWNMSLQINERYLIKGLNKKYILKEFFPKNFLDLPKKGFGVPVGDWLRTFLKEELLYFSSKNIIEKQQIFNFLNLNKLINLHIERKNDYSFQLWTFFCFQKWYLNFYEGN
jgi:asparagine synthase (glutamine-hydrolysing)